MWHRERERESTQYLSDAITGAKDARVIHGDIALIAETLLKTFVDKIFTHKYSA